MRSRLINLFYTVRSYTQFVYQGQRYIGRQERTKNPLTLDRRGSKNPRWRGGIRTAKYVWVYRPEHRFARNSGYVYYHRVVYESYHRCCLLPWASIHHVDRNTMNNFPSNLQGMMKLRHDTMETTEMWQRGIFRNKEATKKDPITGRFVRSS